MPWKETVIVREREAFVMRCLENDESMAQLCREQGISRRVGYKWLSRYRQKGVEGLKDRSKAPHAHPNRGRPGDARSDRRTAGRAHALGTQEAESGPGATGARPDRPRRQHHRPDPQARRADGRTTALPSHDGVAVTRRLRRR